MTRTQIAMQALQSHERATNEAIALWSKGLKGEARQRFKRAKAAFDVCMDMKNRMRAAGEDVSMLP